MTTPAFVSPACAAHVAPADERWGSIATGVVRTLVQQHPLEIGVLGDTLWPARTHWSVAGAAARDGKLPPLAERRPSGSSPATRRNSRRC